MPKAKKTKTTHGIKEPDKRTAPKGRKPVGKPPKSIKMLTSLATVRKAYTMGRTYRVPHDVSVNNARTWIDQGAAEKIS
jgi:hypothetical protein